MMKIKGHEHYMVVYAILVRGEDYTENQLIGDALNFGGPKMLASTRLNEIAKKNGYDMLTFEVGDIKDYKPKFKPDMVISLHACDTATDFALFNAINWDARYILSIPCCQHELNNQMNSSANSIVAPYGLLRERFCAMTTDAIRAKLLEYSGYNVSVMEFIDMEHSPKNILIRAKKKKTPIADAKKAELKNDVETFLKDFGVSQTLHTLLMNNE